MKKQPKSLESVVFTGAQDSKENLVSDLEEAGGSLGMCLAVARQRGKP